MHWYITHTALWEVTKFETRPLVVSVGEVLVKEVCARISLKAVSECGMNAGVDLGFDQEYVAENAKRSQADSRLSFYQENELKGDHHHVIKCLLNSRDYEVRLVTLEHLNTYLSRNHLMSHNVHIASNHGNHDNEILDGLTEAMERIVLTDSHLEDIAVDVLEMAMEKEQHLDCLGQVTNYLYYSNVLEIILEEKFTRVYKMYACAWTRLHTDLEYMQTFSTCVIRNCLLALFIT